ncbi:MAG: response regulator [Desulfobacterales bacterium]|nr:response regulator [Desulfobacterales bacterium]
MAEKVLLVDDEREFLDAMSLRLEARNVMVTCASSAQEAIERVKKASFDAIIIDYQLPGMDGLKALELIKDTRPESRIILLTGYATVEKRSEAIEKGALDLLEKPVDLYVLCEKIRHPSKKE